MLQFRQQRRTYESDWAKITYFIQLLQDRALKWAQEILRTNPEIAYLDFLSKFRSVFEKSSRATAAAHRLLNLKQVRRSMVEYSVDVWILA